MLIMNQRYAYIPPKQVYNWVGAGHRFASVGHQSGARRSMEYRAETNPEIVDLIFRGGVVSDDAVAKLR